MNARTTVEERRFQRRAKPHTIQAGFSPSSLSADTAEHWTLHRD